ncbi:MAG: hypothetical protein L3J83_03825, partial [Proteobacteria bacterium]|nr:hypothetical protein [Pseudomonadota bacterium]
MNDTKYYLKPIFKLDKGRVRVWQAFVTFKKTFGDDSAIYVGVKFSFGLLLGKKQDKNRGVIGKNVNKSNATTP